MYVFMDVVLWSKLRDFVCTFEVNILRSVGCFVVCLHTFIDVVIQLVMNSKDKHVSKLKQGKWSFEQGTTTNEQVKESFEQLTINIKRKFV